MTTSTFLLKCKRLLKRASSLLMLFQRTPAAQLLVPAEFNLAASAAFFGPAEFAIATVVGLGAYDSVAGATTLTRIAGSLNVVAGQPFSATFQVTGSPSEPESWSIESSTPLPAGLDLPNISGSVNAITGTTSEVGSKSVTVQAWRYANFGGEVVQTNVTINVTEPADAAIITSPSSVTINRGQTTTLTVVAAGGDPLTYQWYQGLTGDESMPVGTNAASFSTPSLLENTSYWVKVTNAGNPGGANSTMAMVTVRQPAAITTQPQSDSIFIGNTTTLSVTATGDAPLTYEWFQGNSGTTTTPVGTGSSFTTPALLETTSYWVRVTNIANLSGANSATAIVTVTEPTDPAIFTVSPLPPARTNIEYSATLVAFGGRRPYIWTVTDGNLPDGLILSELGVISGTSGSNGTGAFTVQVTDQDNKTDIRVFELVISDLDITTATLPTAVKGVTYAATLAATGGAEPYSWLVQGGALPAGITLSPEGVLSGKPTAAGNAAITVRVTDSNAFVVTKALLLPVSATFIRPIINPITFPVVTVSEAFNHTVTAQNFPKTFAITGLPKGLTFSASTGVITGSPEFSGVFNVQVRATNTAGTSPAVKTRLTVKALAKGFVGTFTGLVERLPAANQNLGGALTLTTTSNGGFSVRLAGGTSSGAAAASYAATGRMASSAPQISLPLGGQILAMTINPTTGAISGSHGAALLSGWRSGWNALDNPADSLVGYYSMALDLADGLDQGVIGIPQGSGFATFNVSAAGGVAMVGKTADGESITSAGFLATNGDFTTFSPLYKGRGTILGVLKLTEDAEGLFAGNLLSGSLSWFKPTIVGRAYATTFGPLDVKAEGGYLAPSSKGSIVLGLPDPGNVNLSFTDGGLASSATDPDMSFLFTDSNTIDLKNAVNPGKVAITLNPATGAVAGSFNLRELSTPPLVRSKVAFQGQVVRLSNGSHKAVGYFMLPQIPSQGQAATAAAILSGGFNLQ
jgi:hypothetical protein